jgi:hypothetical protein
MAEWNMLTVRERSRMVVVATLIVGLSTCVYGQKGIVYKETGKSKQVYLGGDGKLVYTRDARGNRIPDFSYVGYHAGEKAIPDVAVRVTLSPIEGDNTKAIQNAIDKVGSLPVDKNGHRGALLLRKGVYRIDGRLMIRDSGVVLRGEGPETILVATGYGDKEHKRTLITVGNGERIHKHSARRIVDDYVPVGAHSVTLESAEGYAVGDRIILFRPSTDFWIKEIGMDKVRSVPWKAGAYDLNCERVIVAIKGARVTFDAPNVHPLDKKYDGGAIYHYDAPGRLYEVGIENLHVVSEFATPVPGHPYGSKEMALRSENHGWHGIRLNRNTKNTWVRHVSGQYFGWSLVSARGKNATVTDCVNLGHASQITGGRRYPFMIDGQCNLVQRCLAVEGRHEFVSQARTFGPNVFVDCLGINSKSSIGPHHRYSVGTLFDNVKSDKPMESRNRGNSGTGHGWAGTQTIFYNCVAPGFNVQAPPGGMSWVIGSGADSADLVAPDSLYYQQVQERLGVATLNRLSNRRWRQAIGTYPWAESSR